ncbi:FKBP-type peptidyl-prolyl cis-trans isomerase fkpA [Asticcacaulis biprosthecium C19]|uniref:Peptidyl-prolyl cis-trans isomerase n=1 Tax=Asticcacaulis biprosthecium C19 TaxID=715226 RepID=F4QLA1_9CAUL|nr:FKBP-type peptidyl-prolyl cis-trans isomerase [Asticcacaulis biprosthecium]EGF92246.1 FKBP-type peptidyl-prolyl cis-trans isomerase fkpA [Asticcacaulis biprosthecium C19]
MRLLIACTLAALALPTFLAACSRDDASLEKELAAYQASADAQAAANLQAGKDFLAKTAKEPGVVTLPSGLMYKVLANPNPTAPQPKVTDKVTVNYEGKLIDGRIFDSSYARNQPASFPLNQVVPAWQIGIPLMRKGDSYMLYVPSDLGYGERAMGDDIPANSVLVFKVELLDIQAK